MDLRSEDEGILSIFLSPQNISCVLTGIPRDQGDDPSSAKTYRRVEGMENISIEEAERKIYRGSRKEDMMKIKEGFVLREIAGKAVVIAVGEASKTFHGMINLNSAGKDIWQGVADGLNEDEIAKRLTEIYEVDLETAKEDTHRLVQKMYEAGVIEG